MMSLWVKFYFSFFFISKFSFMKFFFLQKKKALVVLNMKGGKRDCLGQANSFRTHCFRD